VTQEDEEEKKVGWIGCLGDVALCLHFDKILVGLDHCIRWKQCLLFSENFLILTRLNKNISKAI